MANLEGQNWSGNVGVRAVQTKEEVLVNVGAAELSRCMAPCPQFPNAITTSAFGSFYQTPVEHTYNDILPSANFKWDLNRDLVARFAIARTMARPDYSALGGSISADDTTHTGNGGNPDLKPIRSTNVDATLEWYFAPKSLLSAGLFYMDLTNYVAFGTTTMRRCSTSRPDTFDTYTISSPINSSGKVKGVELSWQQQLALRLRRPGQLHVRRRQGRPATGTLVGASKNTYNVDRLLRELRVQRAAGVHVPLGVLRRPRSEHAGVPGRHRARSRPRWATRSTSNLTLTFDALNLNNPTLKYYGTNNDQPRAFYKNGRQYYFTVRFKL